MTKLLEQAFAEASKLSAAEQDEIAARWMAELAADKAWDRVLLKSPEKLSCLAQEAIEEHRLGLTAELGPER